MGLQECRNWSLRFIPRSQGCSSKKDCHADSSPRASVAKPVEAGIIVEKTPKFLENASPVGHGFIEPGATMSLDDYQFLIHSTQGNWAR